MSDQTTAPTTSQPQQAANMQEPYQSTHKVRFVTAASLFDGHDASINIMRRILQSTGAEVIHLGHNRSVQEIVNCAIQEDAQGIAISSYQGGHMEYFKYMVDLLKENDAEHIKVFGGGGGLAPLPLPLTQMMLRIGFQPAQLQIAPQQVGGLMLLPGGRGIAQSPTGIAQRIQAIAFNLAIAQCTGQFYPLGGIAPGRGHRHAVLADQPVQGLLPRGKLLRAELLHHIGQALPVRAQGAGAVQQQVYRFAIITLLLAALIGFIIFYRERNSSRTIRSHYMLGMILESVIYAVLLGLLIGNFVTGILQIIPPESVEELSLLQQLALSLGAGLYEELFFRVFLIFIFYRLFLFIFSKSWHSYLASALLAALIFSFAHYTGSLGEPFTVGSFLYRFLFGLALNAIYVLRGFGMAAWTHASYDIMVVAFI